MSQKLLSGLLLPWLWSRLASLGLSSGTDFFDFYILHDYYYYVVGFDVGVRKGSYDICTFSSEQAYSVLEHYSVCYCIDCTTGNSLVAHYKTEHDSQLLLLLCCCCF